MGHLLTGEVRSDLDRMLLVDAGLGMTRLEWLNSPASDASASSVKTSIEKLAWFRGTDAPQMDLSALPNERRRFLAQGARRSTNQGMERPPTPLPGRPRTTGPMARRGSSRPPRSRAVNLHAPR